MQRSGGLPAPVDTHVVHENRKAKPAIRSGPVRA